MEFDFIKHEADVTVHIPTLPISLNGFPVGHALVDTGASITILPMELNQILNLELNTKKTIELSSAGGGTFKAIPATKKVAYEIEQSGHRRISWKGTVFFSEEQPTVLLGQHQCLDQLKIHLDGKQRKIRVTQ